MIHLRFNESSPTSINLTLVTLFNREKSHLSSLLIRPVTKCEVNIERQNTIIIVGQYLSSAVFIGEVRQGCHATLTEDTRHINLLTQTSARHTNCLNHEIINSWFIIANDKILINLILKNVSNILA